MTNDKLQAMDIVRHYLARLDDYDGISPQSLASITDWYQLRKMRGHISLGSKTYALIEARMAEVLPDLLPTITNWNRLCVMRGSTLAKFGSRALIESRMTEVIAAVIDWEQLCNNKVWLGYMVGNTISDDSWCRDLIEARKKELLPGLLPTITDWSQLSNMLDNTLANSKPHTLISERMAEIISAINIAHIPSWFLDLLESPDTILSSLKFSVDSKTRELAAI